MSDSVTFPAQLASIIEVLANAAVAEICKLVEDGYSVLRLQVCQGQREVEVLRRRLLLTRGHSSSSSSRRSHRAGSRKARGYLSSSACHPVEESRFAVRAGSLARDVPDWDAGGHHQDDTPPAQDSVSDTQRSEGEGDTELPVIKVEVVDSCRIQDMATPGGEKITAAETDASSSLRGAAEAPPPRRRASDTALKTQPETQPNQNQNQKFHHQSLQSKNAKEDLSSESGVSWEDYHYQLLAGGNKPQWDAYQETTDHPSTSLTGPETEGQGSSEHPEGRGSGPGNPGLGSLDWEPDVVLVDSVPIKVEAEMISEWSLVHQGDQGAADKGRVGVESEDATQTTYANPNTQQQHTLQDRATAGGGSRSKFLHANRQQQQASSHAFSSSSSSLRPPRPLLLLHPRDKQQQQQQHVPTLPNALPRGVACSPRLLSEKQPAHTHTHAYGGSSGAGAKRQFRCTLCGKHFPQLAYLRRHERVHTGEKPYGCSHCSKRFSHSHQLKNHERVHTGEKPFTCVYCGKCFTQSSHMKRHLGVHTGHRTTFN